MLRELLSVFRSYEPLTEMARNFSRMINLTYDMTVEAGQILFDDAPSADARSGIYEKDVAVNKLERRIRKQVIAHLSINPKSGSGPYCLLLMSLVKDVERLGDYAKNLAEVRDYHAAPLPEGPILDELRAIRAGAEEAFHDLDDVFETSDYERAKTLILRERDLTRRCDHLVGRIAVSGLDSDAVTAFVMATRFYKRTISHVLNVLSGVVMPVHKLDYYDEKYLEGAGPKDVDADS